MYTYLFIMQEGGRSLFILLHDLKEEQEVGKRKCHHETSFLDKNNGSLHDEYIPALMDCNLKQRNDNNIFTKKIIQSTPFTIRHF